MSRGSISVALCTCNGERYLPEQLASIAAQSRIPDEVVICDDQSTDGTAGVVSAVAKNFPCPIRWSVNERRLGVSKNFERAISISEGDLIFLADQDDWWEGGKIETVTAALADAPGAGYAFSDAMLVGSALEPTGRRLWGQVRFTEARFKEFGAGHQTRALVRGGNVAYGNTMAFRRECLTRILPIEVPNASMTHDTWIALVLSAAGPPGIAIDAPLVRYRQHPAQLAGAGRKRTALEWAAGIVASRLKDFTERADALAAVAARTSRFAPQSEGTEELKALVEHLRARSLACRGSVWKRAPIIWQELRSGRYARYSSSWKSAVRDALET